MPADNLLSELVSRCKGSVSIAFNPHRDSYMSIEQYVREMESRNNETYASEQVKDVLYRNNDHLIEIVFYPDTPVGFYRVIHHNFEAALQKCIDLLD